MSRDRCSSQDLLRGNKPFVRLPISNPKVLADIKALNPTLKIT